MSKRIAIVGAGLGGLTAAIKLKEAGHVVTIFEAADDVGGVWRDNAYPGAACDVPAILYQLSFAPNPHWSHLFARQSEIHAYTRALIDQFALRDGLRLGEGIVSARWNQDDNQWNVTTAKGAQEQFDVLVPATGQLSRPYSPPLPGRENFNGAVFHSARWDQSVELAGKRIGLVGSAASAAQIIPEVARIAGHLTVFQRSASWIVPRGDKPVTPEERTLFMTRPESAMKLYAMQRELIFEAADAFAWQAIAWTAEGRAAYERVARNHLAAQISDPVLRAKLTPDYPIGCKRTIFSDDLYPALARDNVFVETDPIEKVTGAGIVAGNEDHELDVLIFATGFETTDWNWSFEVIGADGRRLKEVWSVTPEAYLGTLVHGFPNMFVIYGPNTNLGHNSITYMMEAQVRYMIDALRMIDREKAEAIEVTAQSQARFNGALQEQLAATVWADPRCRSWYKTADGRNPQNWGGDAQSFAAATKAVRREDVRFIGARDHGDEEQHQ